MAPFLLLASKDGPPESRNKKIIFTENIYNPKVKVTGWQNEREGHPKDNDPYRPHHINLHLASYNKLGCFPDEPMQSTTHAMLEEAIKYKDDYYIPNTNKYMVNYYAFHDTGPCEKPEIPETPCSVCVGNYETTMQASYAPPRPFIMQRVSFKTIPFDRYRKMKWVTNYPLNSDTKFWDDKLAEQMCLIQIRNGSKNARVKRINEL